MATKPATDYEVTITVADDGRVESAGDQLLAAFLKSHPKTDPIVTQNLVVGELSLVLNVEAADAEKALQNALTVFTRAAEASALMPRPIVGLHVAVAHYDSSELPSHDREEISA